MSDTTGELRKPIFDKTFNIGHVFTAVTMCISLLSVGAYSIKASSDVNFRLAALELAYNNESKEVAGTLSQLKANDSQLFGAQSISEERITNAASSVRSFREDYAATINELRRTDLQLGTDLNLTRIDIARLKGKDS